MMKMPFDGKKGITVKIDADLHAEVRQYAEQHSMTMAEFITLALDDELHPKFNQKEGQNMGNMRTLAFQVPENLFQRIKEYLHRNNITQKEFVIGLIEDELDREQTERESAEQLTEESGNDNADAEENTAVSNFGEVSDDYAADAGEQDGSGFSDDFEDGESYDRGEEAECDTEYEDEAENMDGDNALVIGM